MHTLYSKLLFVGAGLLFAFNISAQDTLNQLDENYYRNGYWILNLDNTPLKIKNDKFYSEGNYDHGYKMGIWQTFIDGKLRSKELFQNTKLERYIKYDEDGNVIEMCIVDDQGLIIEGKRAQYGKKHVIKSKINLGRNGKIIDGEYYDAFYGCSFSFKDSLGKYYTFPSKDCDSLKLLKEKPPTTCDPDNLPIEKKVEIVPVKSVAGSDCEIFKRLEKENHYKANPGMEKLIKGYSILCDNKGLVLEVQYYENGKFKKNVSLAEVDSVLNKQLKDYWRDRKLNNGKYGISPIFFNEDGTFKDGLFNGKKYIYDKNGLIEKIEEWKDGKYIGDANFDENKETEKKVPNEWLKGRTTKPITEDGEFRDGKLWNGKKYIYDKEGLLLKIEMYKEGKYAGDAQIE